MPSAILMVMSMKSRKKYLKAGENAGGKMITNTRQMAWQGTEDIGKSLILLIYKK